MTQNGPKLPKMTQNGPKWPKMVQNDPKWHCSPRSWNLTCSKTEVNLSSAWVTRLECPKGVKDEVKQARRAKRVAEGHQLEIGAQRAPRFLVINNFCMEGHTKQLLGNARISSILIVAKESHESSTLSVYPCSQCIDMRRSTSCFILFYCEPQQEKSKKWNLCSTLQATIEDKYKIAHWRKAKQMQLVWLFVLW